MTDVSPIIDPYERQELEYLRARFAEVELGVSATVV
jgi:hypothetical protein